MSVNKDLFQWSIGRSISKITKAKTACGDAASAIAAAENSLSECWQGSAATAMEETLQSIKSEIESAKNLVTAAEAMVQSQGAYLLENWDDPESSEIDA